MPTKKLILQVLVASIFSAGALSAQAADGRYYDPRNAASPTGYTTDYKLDSRIGCPGQSFSGSPCPVEKEADSDGDGVVDSKDKCPNTPKGRKVNAEGCELDTDGDGLVDGDDKCPTVYAKTPDGCPLPVAAPAPAPVPAPAPAPVAAPKKLNLEGVNFDNDKATLRPESFGILDRAAETLKEWGNVKVEVAGHTDSKAGDGYNEALSRRRAETVRDYLISKGVAADRLTAKGYGESSPVADNSTAEGRFQNRRVELVPQQ